MADAITGGQRLKSLLRTGRNDFSRYYKQEQSAQSGDMGIYNEGKHKNLGLNHRNPRQMNQRWWGDRSGIRTTGDQTLGNLVDRDCLKLSFLWRSERMKMPNVCK
jgi:hypothetical protein